MYQVVGTEDDDDDGQNITPIAQRPRELIKTPIYQNFIQMKYIQTTCVLS